MKIKKGDTVLITTGKDKGKQGKVEKVFPSEGLVLLPGLNMFKKHLKKKDERTQGGIIDFSRPIPVGNIALICPLCKQPTRIGYSQSKEERLRICRKCQKPI